MRTEFDSQSDKEVIKDELTKQVNYLLSRAGDTMVERTDAELKEVIREQIKKEDQQKKESERYNRLRAEVIVEDKWDFWTSNDKERDNLKKWYDKWADSNPELYIDMIAKCEMPNYHTQRYEDPDDYEKDYLHPYSIYKYRSKKEIKMDRDDSIKAWLYTVGGFVAVVGGIIYFTILR